MNSYRMILKKLDDTGHWKRSTRSHSVEELWKKTDYWMKEGRKRSKTRKRRDSVIFLDFTFVAMFIPDIWRIQYIKNQVSGKGFRLLFQARVRSCCRKSNSRRRYDGKCPLRSIITMKRMPRGYNIAYKLSILQNCSGGTDGTMGFSRQGWRLTQARQPPENRRRGRSLTAGPIKPEVSINPKHTVLNKHLSRFRANKSWKGITSWLSAPAERQINRLSARVANLELRTTDKMQNI
jgi:hypothetical protein